MQARQSPIIYRITVLCRCIILQYPEAENSWIDVKQLNRTADLRMMKDEFNENND